MSVELILTEEQVKDAYERWCAGYTQEQIAKELFVHRRTVMRAFKRYGLKKEKGKRCPKCGKPLSLEYEIYYCYGCKLLIDSNVLECLEREEKNREKQ